MKFKKNELSAHNLPSEVTANIDSLLTKFGRLMESYFSCDFNYESYDKNSIFLSPHAEQMEKTPTPFNDKNNLYFPLKLDDSLIGLIHITPIHLNQSLEFSKIQNIIQLIITPVLNSIRRKRTLQLLENFMNFDSSSRTTHPSLEDKASLRNTLSLSHLSIHSEVRDRRLAQHLPVLIESPQSKEIFKMALEFHVQFNGSSFLTASLLQNNFFQNIDDLDQLGPVTLFAPELKNLSLADQQNLLSYLSKPTNKAAPQIIVGSTVPLQDLLSDPQVSPELVKKLSSGYLKLGRSSTTKESRNHYVDFFLERNQIDLSPGDGKNSSHQNWIQ